MKKLQTGSKTEERVNGTTVNRAALGVKTPALVEPSKPSRLHHSLLNREEAHGIRY